ncbi:MAG TPA: nuclear transport factor 2 family protein [bacterium]
MKRFLNLPLGLLLVSVACSNQNPPTDEYSMLLEKESVIAMINQLFISTDNRDWEKVKACFAREVLFDMTSLAGGEPSKMTAGQIASAWETGLKDLKAIHHQAGNYSVTINGSVATAFCYGIAFHYLPNPTAQNTRTFVGSYDFHLTKIDGGWRIDQFKFNLKFIDGNLNLEGQ